MNGFGDDPGSYANFRTKHNGTFSKLIRNLGTSMKLKVGYIFGVCQRAIAMNKKFSNIAMSPYNSILCIISNIN